MKETQEVYSAFVDYIEGRLEWSDLETYAEDVVGLLGELLTD